MQDEFAGGVGRLGGAVAVDIDIVCDRGRCFSHRGPCFKSPWIIRGRGDHMISSARVHFAF